MWDELLKQLAGFQSAVITGIASDGYPFSMRCRPSPDPSAQMLRVQVPPDAPIQPGPASLLCHKHDQFLWRQESFIVRGTLAHDEQGWAFQPKQLIPGIRPDPLSLTRFMLDSRRKAKQYLAARGLPRPKIPWEDINRVKARAKQNQK